MARIRGGHRLRRRLIVLGVLAVTLPAIALDGHPEDLIALGAMLYGLIAALQGRSRAVGWWLGVALAFQFLAFLAVPMALVLLKRKKIEGNQRFEAIVPMILLPLLVLAVPLATEASATVRQLIHQKVYDIAGFITPTWNLDPGVAAFIRALVALAAIPAVPGGALTASDRHRPGQRGGVDARPPLRAAGPRTGRCRISCARPWLWPPSARRGLPGGASSPPASWPSG